MISTILQALFFICFPVLAIIGARRSAVLAFLDPVVICYLVGIGLANIPGLELDESLAGSLSEVAVVLAIPMLLFSTDVRSWLTVAPRALLSFVLACVSVVAAATAARYLFADHVVDAHKVAAMTIGVYTGGTPNMSAIGVALEVPQETFVTLNAADVVLALLYIPLLVVVLIRLLRRFFPPYKSTEAEASVGEVEPEQPFFRRDNARAVVKTALAATGLSAAALGISIGAAFGLTGEMNVVVIILGVTTLGIGASFVGPIRRLPGSYDVGQYILLVFCLSVGSLADLGDLIGSLGALAGFLFFVFWVALALHFLLNYLARIDADTAAITSIAAVMGPPLVGPIAGALKNRELVLPGVTTGVIGYALGNYIGLAVAYFLGP